MPTKTGIPVHAYPLFVEMNERQVWRVELVSLRMRIVGSSTKKIAFPQNTDVTFKTWVGAFPGNFTLVDVQNVLVQRSRTEGNETVIRRIVQEFIAHPVVKTRVWIKRLRGSNVETAFVVRKGKDFVPRKGFLAQIRLENLAPYFLHNGENLRIEAYVGQDL